jgi:hypothetical protein
MQRAISFFCVAHGFDAVNSEPFSASAANSFMDSGDFTSPGHVSRFLDLLDLQRRNLRM